MDWYDQPTIQEAPAQDATAPAARSVGGVRRGVITAVLSAGLLIAGGVAVVNAASPDPSASDTPNATTQPSDDSGGTGGTAPSTQPRGGNRTGHNCPQGGSGGANGSGTDNSAPSSSAPDSSSGASSSDA